MSSLRRAGRTKISPAPRGEVNLRRERLWFG
jgi:hypothetical protein